MTRAWIGRQRLALVVIAAVGVAVHLWFALGGDALDADRALVLLMARHFAHGEWSLYFWQQNYMVALEPLLLTPFAWAGLATPLVAGLVGMALTAVLATLSVRLAKRLGGTPWMALLVWAVPPALVAHHHVALYGARLAATVLVFVAFTWSLEGSSRRGWIGVGVLAGLAYASDHNMLPWAMAVMFVGVRRGFWSTFVLGALPVVGLDTLLAATTTAVHLAGPNAPGEWLPNVALFAGTVLPQFFGILLSRAPTPSWEPLASIVPQAPLWPVVAILGGGTLVLLLATLFRHRRRLFTPGPPGAVAVQALLLAVATQVGLFLLTGGGGETWSVRYLVPLWPALSVFLALGANAWSPRLRPAAALALLPAAFTLCADHSWPRYEDAAPARARAEAIHGAVTSADVEAVWAEYWDAYPTALLTGEMPRWGVYRGIQRRPDWAEEAERAEPVAYLVREGDTELLAALDGAVARGGRRLAQRRVGSVQLIVMDHSVPGLSMMNAPPPRSIQVVSALAAGLIFVGALATAGILPRLLRLGG